MLAALVPQLRRRGVRVVLATVGTSTLPVDERICVFDDGQFAQLQRPFNRVMGVAAAHLHRVVTEVRRRDDITLVHDHQEALGLTVLGALGRNAAPVLHTLHWDLGKHPALLRRHRRLRRRAVGERRVVRAAGAGTAGTRAVSVGHVHLATPLAVGADRRPTARKDDHLVVLGRVTRCKGQHVAARIAHRTARSSRARPARSVPATAPTTWPARRGQPGRPVLAGGRGAAGRRDPRAVGRHGRRQGAGRTHRLRPPPRWSRSTGMSPAEPRWSRRSRWARRWSALARLSPGAGRARPHRPAGRPRRRGRVRRRPRRRRSARPGGSAAARPPVASPRPGWPRGTCGSTTRCSSAAAAHPSP